MDWSFSSRMVVAGVLALVALGGSPPASADPASARLDFEDAIQTFNRDVVYLDHSTLRNPTKATPEDAQLYSEVGAARPVTWAQWQASSASSVVTTLGAPDTPSTQARL